MINEKKLRIASIVLFMRALIDELEPNQKATDAVTKICIKGKKYVNSNFRKSEDQELLSTIVNGAWDDACRMGEVRDVAVSALCMYLFDSNYRQDMVDAGFNEKHFQTFYNQYRNNTGLKLRFSNKEISNYCIKCINKHIYDKFTSKQ